MSPAEEKQVFEVMEVEDVGQRVWKIRGRVYQDIRLGEIIYALTNAEVEVPFEVIAIMAFGRSLPEISRGFGCEIVIKGQKGELLRQVTHLYRI